MTNINKIKSNLVRLYSIDNEENVRLRIGQEREIEAEKYKYKMLIEYKGELKKPGNGLMAYIAFQLSSNPNMFSVVVDERNIVVYFQKEEDEKLIKKLFNTKRKSWNLTRDNTNEQEQLRYIKSDKQIYFDKTIHQFLREHGNKQPNIVKE